MIKSYIDINYLGIKVMKYCKIANLVLIIFLFDGCGILDDPVREYTSIYSVNLETGIVTKRCNLGYGYEQNYSAMESYYFSPDMKRFVRIDSDTSDGYWIYNYYDINTGEKLNTITTLEEGEWPFLNLKYSLDGNKITFCQDFIYCVNVNGTNQVKLELGTYPSFSPDGKKILYLSEDDYLTLYDLELEQYQRLYGESVIEYPIFHPNGEKIYFFDDSDLKTFNLDDSTVTVIAEDIIFSCPIKFSKTGDRKVFSSFMKTFTLDESDNIRLMNEYSPNPCISQSGSKIAFDDGVIKVTDFDELTYEEYGHVIDNVGFGFTPDEKEIYYIDTWKDE